jgi:hypothetical protein
MFVNIVLNNWILITQVVKKFLPDIRTFRLAVGILRCQCPLVPLLYIWGIEVKLLTFLTLALTRGEWSAT